MHIWFGIGKILETILLVGFSGFVVLVTLAELFFWPVLWVAEHYFQHQDKKSKKRR